VKSRNAAGVIGRLGLAGLFAAATRLLYDIEVHGLTYDAGAPRTYFTITHKRDLDALAPVPIVLGHRGWAGLAGDVHFAMRADSFQRGFLARIVLQPRWFAHLLRPLGVGPVLRAVGVHPLRDLRQYPGEAWLRETLAAEGDPAVGELLAPEYLSHLARAGHRDPHWLAAQPLSELLSWRYHQLLQPYTGAEIFNPEARRRAERRAAEASKAMLSEQALWLWRGGSLYGAPEGHLSPDGHLSPISTGFVRVLRASPRDTRVIPVAIVYDFMTARRMRIFTDLGPAIERAPDLPRRELEMRLRTGWPRAARFTCTQLASGFITEAASGVHPRFTTDELAAAVESQAVALQAAGRRVDSRLLTPREVHTATRAYLAYAHQRKLVRGLGGKIWEARPLRPMPPIPPGGVGYEAAPLVYARNELEEMLAVT
jgi:hypothetical protein